MVKELKLQVDYVDIDMLIPYEGNPRKISDKGIDKLKQSIESFGFTNPILVQKSSNMIIAGHQRLKAAKKAGLKQVPVIFLDFDDVKAKAYNLADNRLADESEWNMEMLASIIQELELLGQNLLTTGFDISEIEDYLNWPVKDEIEEDDFDVEEVVQSIEVPKVKLGDIWALGDHRLICGDCTDIKTVEKLLEYEKAAMIITSPPYAEQRKNQYASIPADQYPEWFLKVASVAWQVLVDEGSLFVNIKEHSENGQRSLYVMKMVIAMVEHGWKYVDQLIWNKQGLPGGWKNRLRNDFEPIHYFVKHEDVNWMVQLVEVDEDMLEKLNAGFYNEHENIFHFSKQRKIKFKPKAVGTYSENVTIYDKNNIRYSRNGNVGIYGKKRKGIARPSNVISIPVNNEQVEHPAVFPVKLPAFFIKLTSDEGEIVYEPFSGSGTTIIAAEQLKRRCYAVELKPLYCDVAIKRWEKFTGKKAQLISGD